MSERLRERPDQSLLDEIVPLLGRVAEPVHMPSGEGHGGGDVDCLVWGLDRAWPLRAPAGWRLAQIIQYDAVAWYWVFDRAGDVIAIDTLCDPDGIGQYAWPVTRDVFPLGPGVRAAYLTAKRLRKGIGDAAEWSRIRALAQQDAASFRRVLEGPFGDLAGAVADEVLSAGVPQREWARARRAQARRRARTPGRAFKLVTGQVARVVGRVARPTGFHLLLVGPDGTGKSTLSETLRSSCAPLFRRTEGVHWRPGVLPRSSAVSGRPERDPTDPHGGRVRGSLPSLVFASYHWIDFFAGGWARTTAQRIRSTLVVNERGWHDVAVDPRRYRLSVSPALVRALGALLPRPDLVVVLRTTPDVAAARKAELDSGEIERQTSEWIAHPPPARRIVVVDADRPIAEVEATVRNEMVAALNARALSRIGGGWAGLPTRARARWWIPRRPAGAASAGMSVHQPVTPRGTAIWRAARAVARSGALSLVTRRAPIPEEVRAAVAPLLAPGGTVSLLRANHPHRYVVLIMDGSGTPAAVAKVAFDGEGVAALGREHDALRGVARSLPLPLVAPAVRHSAPGVLVTEAARWKPRARPWRLEPDAARALGEWFRAGATDAGSGPGHGDFAPWNVLRAERGWVVVDWEEARPDAPPFDDLFHHFVQSHALLGRPSSAEILASLRGEGELGELVAVYAQAAGLPDGPSVEGFLDYLRRSYEKLPAETPDGAAGRRARERLAAALPGASFPEARP